MTPTDLLLFVAFESPPEPSSINTVKLCPSPFGVFAAAVVESEICFSVPLTTFTPGFEVSITKLVPNVLMSHSVNEAPVSEKVKKDGFTILIVIVPLVSDPGVRLNKRIVRGLVNDPAKNPICGILISGAKSGPGSAELSVHEENSATPKVSVV